MEKSTTTGNKRERADKDLLTKALFKLFESQVRQHAPQLCCPIKHLPLLSCAFFPFLLADKGQLVIAMSFGGRGDICHQLPIPMRQ